MQDWGFNELTAVMESGFVKMFCERCTSSGLVNIMKKLNGLQNVQQFVNFLNSALDKTGKSGKGELRNLMLWLDNVVYSNVNPLIQNGCNRTTFNEISNQPPGNFILYIRYYK